MSVKISRREEARETPLRDFLLAATLPLLLTGLLGYFIGLAGRTDTKVDSSDISQMEARALAAERQLAERERFVGAIDSLLTAHTAAKKERQDEFAQLVAQRQPAIEFGDPLANWSRDLREDYDRFAREISELQGSVAGRANISEEAVRPVIDLFQELNQQTRTYFISQRTAYSLQSTEQRVMSETINEQAKDQQDEVDDLRGQLNTANRKIENRDITIANLQAAQQAGGDGAVAQPVSYRQEKNTIKDAAVEIEAISKRIPSGVLVSRKKKTELETEILKQVAKIEQALEVIE